MSNDVITFPGSHLVSCDAGSRSAWECAAAFPPVATFQPSCSIPWGEACLTRHGATDGPGPVRVAVERQPALLLTSVLPPCLSGQPPLNQHQFWWTTSSAPWGTARALSRTAHHTPGTSALGRSGWLVLAGPAAPGAACSAGGSPSSRADPNSYHPQRCEPEEAHPETGAHRGECEQAVRAVHV